MNASIFPSVPLISIITFSCWMSTTRPRNALDEQERSPAAARGGHVTLMSIRSRSTKFSRADVVHPDDGDDLVELLADLLEDGVVAVDDEGHAREVVVLGLADGEAVDVEPAGGEHAGDVGQDAGLVLHQGGEHVPHRRGPFGAGGRELVAGESYGPRPAGRLNAPARRASAYRRIAAAPGTSPRELRHLGEPRQLGRERLPPLEQRPRHVVDHHHVRGRSRVSRSSTSTAGATTGSSADDRTLSTSGNSTRPAPDGVSTSTRSRAASSPDAAPTPPRPPARRTGRRSRPCARGPPTAPRRGPRTRPTRTPPRTGSPTTSHRGATPRSPSGRPRRPPRAPAGTSSTATTARARTAGTRTRRAARRTPSTRSRRGSRRSRTSPGTPASATADASSQNPAGPNR